MIKRTLMLVEAQSIVDWYNDFQKEKIKELPIKVQWNILFAVKELQQIVLKFEEFRNGLVQELQNNYFGNDEKSESFQQEKKCDDGSIMFDENGKPVIEEMRKIKKEYVNEYNNRVNDLNNEISNLLMEKTTYNFKEIDIDKIVDNLKDDTNIKLNDINMMSFLDINIIDRESE